MQYVNKQKAKLNSVSIFSCSWGRAQVAKPLKQSSYRIYIAPLTAAMYMIRLQKGEAFNTLRSKKIKVDKPPYLLNENY